MKKIWVISLGGSVLLKNDHHTSFLLTLRKILETSTQKNKFVIVCGGGHQAREYIAILREEHKSHKEQSLGGIEVTRTNARFAMRVFGKKANEKLPLSMKEVKDELKKNGIVVCGALRYKPNQTSDSTAAQIAAFLNAEFINITNVSGLFTADPRTNKNARHIPLIDWESFEKKASKKAFKPGQHFVLDQKAATLIRQKKITTYIVGPDTKQLKNILTNKPFKGTLITC